MSVGTVAAFWALSFLFVITPGADWAYAMAAWLRHRTVLPAVGGLLAGHLAATAAVAAGVAVVVARSPMVLAALTLAGAAYLIWLGVSTLTHPSLPQSGAEQATESWVRQAAKGAGISGLNPKVFLLFLALLPQFANPDAMWPVPVQIAVLGLVHVASCAVVYIGVGTGARRALRARPTAAKVVTRVSGGAMVVLGPALLVEQLVGWVRARQGGAQWEGGSMAGQRQGRRERTGTDAHPHQPHLRQMNRPCRRPTRPGPQRR